jgi:hypothetical protein
MNSLKCYHNQAAVAYIGWEQISEALRLEQATARPWVQCLVKCLERLPAKDALTSLVGRWDSELFARTFDPQSLRYSWNKHLAEHIAKIAATHGACRPDGELRAYAPLDGQFRLRCER